MNTDKATINDLPDEDELRTRLEPGNAEQYFDFGCSSRGEYLDQLAEEYSLPKWLVYEAAFMLGSNEDFDGLVNTLEDEEGNWND